MSLYKKVLQWEKNKNGSMQPIWNYQFKHDLIRPPSGWICTWLKICTNSVKRNLNGKHLFLVLFLKGCIGLDCLQAQNVWESCRAALRKTCSQFKFTVNFPHLIVTEGTSKTLNNLLSGKFRIAHFGSKCIQNPLNQDERGQASNIINI